MNIRTAQISDIAPIVEFNIAMALETEGLKLDRSTLKAGVEGVFTDETKGFYVIAEDEGKVAGCLLITTEWSDWRNGWFWWIQSVYILPEARGKGTYRQLYEFVKKLSVEAGNVCGFRLYVEKKNARAQEVYEKVGMKASHYVMFEDEN